VTTCDVDASLLMYDENYNLVDSVSFMRLTSADNSCKHSGDDRHGKNAEGDNEVISIDLNLLNPKVKSIWPILNVYSGFNSFRDVNGAYCRILDSSNNVISRVDL